MMMPPEFSVSIEEVNEVIFVCFREIGTNKPLHLVCLFVDEDEEQHLRGFSTFSEEGQKQILKEMRQFVIEDINKLITEDHDDEIDLFPIEHRTYFDHQEFEKRWYTFYDMIVENMGDYDKYLGSHYKKSKKQSKKNKKKK